MESRSITKMPYKDNNSLVVIVCFLCLDPPLKTSVHFNNPVINVTWQTCLLQITGKWVLKNALIFIFVFHLEFPRFSSQLLRYDSSETYEKWKTSIMDFILYLMYVYVFFILYFKGKNIDRDLDFCLGVVLHFKNIEI